MRELNRFWERYLKELVRMEKERICAACTLPIVGCMGVKIEEAISSNMGGDAV